MSEQDFLVSANRGGKFVLYLMDVDGNRELIYEGAYNIFHAMPLRPAHAAAGDRRPRRLARPRATACSPKGGVIYSSNVYQGAPPELRGKARYLRVLNIEHKTYTYWYKRPYLSTGPVVSAVQSEGVKRDPGHRADRGRRLGGLPRPAGHAAALPASRRELPGAADDAELRRA